MLGANVSNKSLELHLKQLRAQRADRKARIERDLVNMAWFRGQERQESPLVLAGW